MLAVRTYKLSHLHEAMASPGSRVSGGKNMRFDTTTKRTFDSVYEGDNVNEIISHDESVAQLRARSVYDFR